MDGTEPVISDFEGFARSVLGWTFHTNFYVRVEDLVELPEDLVADLPDFGEMLKPDYAVRHRTRPSGDGPEWQLIVRRVDPGQGLDAAEAGSGTLDATAHGRLERLLRATGVEAGMLFNGRAIRLVSAPRGESSGWLDFRVRDMLETQGRSIVAAMRLLLGEARLLRVPERARLTALLKESRQFQNVVSERLAEQVLHALYELVRGLQAAHDRSRGKLLREVLERDPDEVYRGLLTVILRMVFCSTPSSATFCPRAKSLPETTRWEGSSTAFRRMPPSIRPRWTSATGRGRSSWCCSGWSTTGHGPEASGCQRGRVRCSIRNGFSS